MLKCVLSLVDFDFYRHWWLDWSSGLLLVNLDDVILQDRKEWNTKKDQGQTRQKNSKSLKVFWKRWTTIRIYRQHVSAHQPPCSGIKRNAPCRRCNEALKVSVHRPMEKIRNYMQLTVAHRQLHVARTTTWKKNNKRLGPTKTQNRKTKHRSH